MWFLLRVAVLRRLRPPPCATFDDRSGGLEDARCLFEQLVARESVRLTYHIDDGDSWETWDVQMGSEDGLARRRLFGHINLEPDNFDETYRCELKPPSHFSDCLESLQLPAQSSEDTECIRPHHWFEDCFFEEDPICP